MTTENAAKPAQPAHAAFGPPAQKAYQAVKHARHRAKANVKFEDVFSFTYSEYPEKKEIHRQCLLSIYIDTGA